MSRRFAGAGLVRRPGARSGGGGASAAPTPFSIFGANLVHEWDAALSTITIATGVSSISDLRGGKNLAQGSGALQPTRVAADLQSYLLGSGAQNLQNATMSLSGDLTLLCVGQYVSLSGSHNLFNAQTAAIYAVQVPAPTFNGFVTDSTGTDIITGGASNLSIHAFALRNATAVARKSYVDGGAGVAGARTAAMNAATVVTLFTNGAGGNGANARIYWAGIVSASGALANLNAWGAWANARFGTTWSTAT